MIKSMCLPCFVAITFLAGCMPPPPQYAQYPATPAYPSAPAAIAAPPLSPPPMPAQGIAGLESRTPDLCGAKEYRQHIGQPGSIVPSLGLSKDYRLVQYRGIVPQDYDPNRLVFQLDASGNISNVDCG